MVRAVYIRCKEVDKKEKKKHADSTDSTRQTAGKKVDTRWHLTSRPVSAAVLDLRFFQKRNRRMPTG